MYKVGIITTFHQPNWGSVLQAYALQKVIDDMGHEAWLIDYMYPNEFHYSSGIPRNRSRLRNLPGDIFNRIKIAFGQMPERKMVLLERFIKDNMRLTQRYMSYEDLHQSPPVFDVYIAGSDQIWNPQTMMGDMSYLLDFAPESSLKFSYASSFSGVNVPEKYKTDYQNNLNRLSEISVREDNGAKAVRELTGREATVVLDPTLLLDKEHWLRFADKARTVQLPDKFILCYMLGYTYNPDETMSSVLCQLQRQYGIPVVALNTLPSSFNGDIFRLPKNYGVGIEEFLFLLNRATIIATSSFHGTAFAINLGKPFIAVADGKADDDGRISSFLDKMWLQRQIVKSTDVISELCPYYNEEESKKQLNSLRDMSYNYLVESLVS